MIDCNVRSVKIEGEFYHTRTKTRGAKELCQFCGNRENCETLNNAKDVIIECDKYQFPIMFRDPKGLDGLFNTMRLGKTWSKRVFKDDIVALVNKEGRRIGLAKVREVFLLSKEEAIVKHSEENHLFKVKQDKQVSVIARMEKILRASYGNLVYNNNDQITVINLEQI